MSKMIMANKIIIEMSTEGVELFNMVSTIMDAVNTIVDVNNTSMIALMVAMGYSIMKVKD